MKKKCIIIDIDGTLANISHRREKLLLTNNWKEFNSSMHLDIINDWCREIIELFKEKYYIVLVTGRSEEFSTVTSEWLKENHVFYNELLFRAKNDYRDDRVIKEEIYTRFIEPFYSTLFVVDDRKKVVDMWRGLGLVCLQCDFGDY